jgi:hypothetical protein
MEPHRQQSNTVEMMMRLGNDRHRMIMHDDGRGGRMEEVIG